MLFKEIKTIIIAGCGRLGANLAESLSSDGYRIVIIDKNRDTFRKLPVHFSGQKITADATDIDVLERAGIMKADIFIAATDNDNTNNLLSQIANSIYGIKKVYMRQDDPQKNLLTDDSDIEIIYPFKLSTAAFEHRIAKNI